MNKQMIAGIAMILLVLPLASSLKLEMHKEMGDVGEIFSPGHKVVFRLPVSDDVQTVTLVIMKDNKPVLTDRMKILSMEPKEFAYAYQLPEDMEQGDYQIKVLAKGDTTESHTEEMYIGKEVKLNFVENTKKVDSLKEGITRIDDGTEAIGEDSFFQWLWRLIVSLFENE